MEAAVSVIQVILFVFVDLDMDRWCVFCHFQIVIFMFPCWQLAGYLAIWIFFFSICDVMMNFISVVCRLQQIRRVQNRGPTKMNSINCVDNLFDFVVEKRVILNCWTEVRCLVSLTLNIFFFLKIFLFGHCERSAQINVHNIESHNCSSLLAAISICSFGTSVLRFYSRNLTITTRLMHLGYIFWVCLLDFFFQKISFLLVKLFMCEQIIFLSGFFPDTFSLMNSF